MIRRHWRWLALTLAALVVIMFAAAFFIDEPLRRRMESEMNRRLDGYSVTIRKLDFHPIGFSLDLEDVVLVQDAHPDPPVARFPVISASVQWREIIRAKVVANFRVDRPVLYVNRAHFEKEAEDDVPVEKRGWQEAVQAIYPLKINEFRVVDGQMTYVDDARVRPLHVSRLNIRAGNIRNIASRDRVYPSDIHADAVVFDRGRLLLDGDADFLAAPHAGVKAAVELDAIALEFLDPVFRRYNLTTRKGTLSATGDLEYAPTVKMAHLKTVTLSGLEADYVHLAQTKAKEQRVAKAVKESAKEVSNHPQVLLRVDELRVVKSNVGFVNRAADPDYRVFLGDVDLSVKNFSNQRTEGTATARLTGKFMGSGRTLATATFRPERKGPDFDLDVKIEQTEMPSMNDLLRAYGKFDVVAGEFSLYSELRVKNGAVAGYVKPLFKDLDVYDKRQDKEKGVFRKLYEGLVGGVSKLLENTPRDEVATKADLTGPVQNPNANTMEVVVRLIQNAFFRAILPGFDRELGRGSSRLARR